MKSLSIVLAVGVLACAEPAQAPPAPPPLPPLQPPTPYQQPGSYQSYGGAHGGPAGGVGAPVGNTAPYPTYQQAPAPAPTASQNQGGLVSNASRVVARMRSAFRRCFSDGLEKDADLAGSVVLVAKIPANGGVESVGGGSDELALIVPCLKGVIATGKFAPPDNGIGATVSIPLTFVNEKE